MQSIFKVLLDLSGDAFALSKVVLGQAITGALNGLLAFGFRDSSGNATMPQLNDEGALPVTLDAGTTLVIPAMKKTQTEMETAGQNTRVLFGTLGLLENRTYNCPSMFCSATRWTLFELVKVEDAGGAGETEEMVGFAILEAGQTSIQFSLSKDKFTTNATVDTKELRMYATHKDNKASDTYMKASCNLTAVS